jgi:hypothetical protein
MDLKDAICGRRAARDFTAEPVGRSGVAATYRCRHPGTRRRESAAVTIFSCSEQNVAHTHFERSEGPYAQNLGGGGIASFRELTEQFGIRYLL